MEDINPLDRKISLTAAAQTRTKVARQGLYHRQDTRGLKDGISRKRDLKRTLRDHRR